MPPEGVGLFIPYSRLSMARIVPNETNRVSVIEKYVRLLILLGILCLVNDFSTIPFLSYSNPVDNACRISLIIKILDWSMAYK